MEDNRPSLAPQCVTEDFSLLMGMTMQACLPNLPEPEAAELEYSLDYKAIGPACAQKQVCIHVCAQVCVCVHVYVCLHQRLT